MYEYCISISIQFIYLLYILYTATEYNANGIKLKSLSCRLFLLFFLLQSFGRWQKDQDEEGPLPVFLPHGLFSFWNLQITKWQVKKDAKNTWKKKTSVHNIQNIQLGRFLNLRNTDLGAENRSRNKTWTKLGRLCVLLYFMSCFRNALVHSATLHHFGTSSPIVLARKAKKTNLSWVLVWAFLDWALAIKASPTNYPRNGRLVTVWSVDLKEIWLTRHGTRPIPSLGQPQNSE